MPILREQKISPEYASSFRAMGPCLSVGMEVWAIEGKRLLVGEVTEVVKGRGVYIRRVGGTVYRTPVQTVMLAEVRGWGD